MPRVEPTLYGAIRRALDAGCTLSVIPDPSTLFFVVQLRRGSTKIQKATPYADMEQHRLGAEASAAWLITRALASLEEAAP